MGVIYSNGMENILNDSWDESTSNGDEPNNSILMQMCVDMHALKERRAMQNHKYCTASQWRQQSK